MSDQLAQIDIDNNTTPKNSNGDARSIPTHSLKLFVPASFNVREGDHLIVDFFEDQTFTIMVELNAENPEPFIEGETYVKERELARQKYIDTPVDFKPYKTQVWPIMETLAHYDHPVSVDTIYRRLVSIFATRKALDSAIWKLCNVAIKPLCSVTKSGGEPSLLLTDRGRGFVRRQKDMAALNDHRVSVRGMTRVKNPKFEGESE